MNKVRQPNQSEIANLVEFIFQRQVKGIPMSVSGKALKKIILEEIRRCHIAVFDGYTDENLSKRIDEEPEPEKQWS